MAIKQQDDKVLRSYVLYNDDHNISVDTLSDVFLVMDKIPNLKVKTIERIFIGRN